MLRMSVVVLAEDEDRHQVQEKGYTQVVNAHGGLIQLKTHLHVGQSFLLSNPKNGHGNELPRGAHRGDRHGVLQHRF